MRLTLISLVIGNVLAITAIFNYGNPHTFIYLLLAACLVPLAGIIHDRVVRN